MEDYENGLLPAGIRSMYVENVNGLRMHLLEAGAATQPTVLLLHGFPELAFSWRGIMPMLADAGYHVIAPDQRGYGRTTGWDADYDGDLASFRPLNLVRDALGLVRALGLGSVYLAGHDFGSPVAAWCGMVRPDVFTRVALMSAPFGGPPEIQDGRPKMAAAADLADSLAALTPPRKHYQHYYQSREANDNLCNAPQGISALLRGYYHFKSADHAGNQPHRLEARTAEAMAVMPTYYIMDLAEGMAETVARQMPGAAAVESNRWLADAELSLYSSEFARTGFQGGLNWYRAVAASFTEQQLYSGRRLEQPTLFIAGASDWGTYQNPGALERMETEVCADLRGTHLLEGAGHWVQQEQAHATANLLIEFFDY